MFSRGQDSQTLKTYTSVLWDRGNCRNFLGLPSLAECLWFAMDLMLTSLNAVRWLLCAFITGDVFVTQVHGPDSTVNSIIQNRQEQSASQPAQGKCVQQFSQTSLARPTPWLARQTRLWSVQGLGWISCRAFYPIKPQKNVEIGALPNIRFIIALVPNRGQNRLIVFCWIVKKDQTQIAEPCASQSTCCVRLKMLYRLITG